MLCPLTIHVCLLSLSGSVSDAVGEMPQVPGREPGGTTVPTHCAV